VVTFPSFGSEGHGVQPTLVFFVSTKFGMKRPFNRGQETLLTVKYIQLIISFLMEAVFIRLYPVGEDLQKNGS